MSLDELIRFLNNKMKEKKNDGKPAAQAQPPPALGGSLPGPACPAAQAPHDPHNILADASVGIASKENIGILGVAGGPASDATRCPGTKHEHRFTDW